MYHPIGTYIKAIRNVYADLVIASYDKNSGEYGVMTEYTSVPIEVPAGWLGVLLQRGEVEIPEGRYEIWDEEGCTCGVKHTAFPSIHLTYCNMGDK